MTEMQSTFRMVQPHQSRVMLMENCNENDTLLPTTTNVGLHSVLIAVWAKPRILEGLSAHHQSSRGRKVVPGGPTYHKNQEFSSHAHTRVVVQGGINKQIRWYILWFFRARTLFVPGRTCAIRVDFTRRTNLPRWKDCFPSTVTACWPEGLENS